MATRTMLPPLLGAAFPPQPFEPDEAAALVRLQDVLDAEIAPRAAAADAEGRYPTASMAALRESGILASGVPRELGGLGAGHRFSLEAQVRIAAADSSVAQLFKVHDEMVREVFTYCPDALAEPLARRIVEDRAVIGLAVAERGKRVDDPMRTVAAPQADGSYIIDGTKIYTTGAAEADLIAVWAFDPVAGADDPARGLQLNLVPRGTPGVEVHRDWNAMGQRATDSGTVTFTAVRTDPALRASEPDRLPVIHAPLRWQAGFAAVLLGNAIGAVRAALPYIAEVSRPWPAANVESAADDPLIARRAGELVSDLVAAYAATLATGDLLDLYEHGGIDRTGLAIPIYAAKAAASRAAVRATTEVFALMGTGSTFAGRGYDRYWRNARTLSLHDPVDWKEQEIGRHLLTGWEPPFGIYT